MDGLRLIDELMDGLTISEGITLLPAPNPKAANNVLPVLLLLLFVLLFVLLFAASATIVDDG
jgi:hypothetical protein